MAKDFFRKGPHAAKNKVNVVDAEVVSDADERKTVILDEQLEGVEFDDKVWLYWTRNKKSIIASVVLAFAIIIGVQSYKLYKTSSENKLAQAYAAAYTETELASFANENKGTSLAGVALLQNADSQYKAGKYAEAQKLYAQAKGDLRSSVLFGRALLGEAMSAYNVDKNKGVELLTSVYNDASVNSAFKSQAGYLLGLALKDQNKIEEAKKVLTSVAENVQAGYFAQMARSTLMSM
ncbi:MAG: tetratricopeptide repeat protein [Verrucomicrobiaceae bacterium]|nr:tetratricopeptide repeat protein [Verrucomicrobiaceae bacterium]